LCGGKDRFRFDNKKGRGTWFCSRCGSGDGFNLLMKLNSWAFTQSAREIERVLGMSRQDAPRNDFSDEEKRQALRRTYKESKPVQVGDTVWEYLVKRAGIKFMPDGLRFHPRLRYDADHAFPAMLAMVTMPDGTASTMHRTWLDGKGGKAPVEDAKKVMGGQIKSGCVRLSPVAARIGIAEGIETALAASSLFGLPVWSAISANGMQQWEPPAGVETVVIFGDNDENYTGQNAAYALARKLAMGRVAVESVAIPAKVGTDWADVAAEEFGHVVQE
jgi:putative DNA primase/helicase